jgi:hypothetical protein
VFAAVLAVRATALVARAVLASRTGTPPAVTVTVIDGQTRRDVATDTREYVFVVRATNPSATERRFTATTLRVTYRTRANFLGAVDLTSAEPFVVAAGQTATTNRRFVTANVIPRHCRIDAYTLLLVDESG